MQAYIKYKREQGAPEGMYDGKLFRVAGQREVGFI